MSLVLAVVTVGTVAAQTGTITGSVLDAQTLAPIGSAQVFNAELSIGVLTGSDGQFVLTNVPAGTHTLTVQRIGYSTIDQQVTVSSGETATVDFELSQDALALDAVIVTGTPGGTQRRALGNVVGRVDAAQVAEVAPAANVQDLLAAREPGLSFARASGNVGTGSGIRIRGLSSIAMGSQPLIYVDGVRVDNEGQAGPNIRDGAQVSKLSDFNPEDIASIEVIKGPAAATLYGTEASAGVIQIITKRGASGAPQFDFMVRQGANWLANASEKIGPAFATDPDTGEIVSFNIWETEKAAGRQVLTTGHSQNYSLSMRGGTDLVRYFLSADYNDNVGIVDYNWDKGMAMRANVTVIPTPRLTLDVSTGYTDGETSFMQQYTGYGVWEQMQWSNPLGLGRTLRGFLRARPEEIAEIEATREYSRFTGSATVTHTPTDWLTQRLIVGTDISNDQNEILFPRQPEGNNHDFGGLSLGMIDVERPSTSYNTLDYALSLEYGLSDWDLTTSFGAQYYNRSEQTVFANGRVFPAPAIRSLAGAATTTSDQYQIQNKSVGAYVQQEASINNRLFLTAAVRGDDNSAFGAEYDAAIYPKLSAAWVISEESFWPEGSFVNSLRLRSAWGQAGRQPDLFAAATLYAPTVGPDATSAVVPDVLGNPDLGPEVSTEIEAGFDAAFFNDRISSEFTYYSQKVNDALLDIPVAGSSGFPGSQSVNLGQISNWGWELSLNSRALDREQFDLDLGLGLSFNDNRIDDLGGRAPTNTIREGWPYPAVQSRVIYSGEFEDTGEVDKFGDPIMRPANLMCDGGIGDLNLRGGEAVACSEAPQVLLGRSIPKWEASFTSTLTLFDNLSLNALVEWRGEHYLGQWDVGCQHTCFPVSRAINERTDPTFIAAADDVVENADLEIAVFNAAFAKLRNVSANYVLPDNLAGRLGASRASINLAATNPWTIWVAQKEVNGVRIADPESRRSDSAATFSNSNVPPLTSLILTMRLSF